MSDRHTALRWIWAVIVLTVLVAHAVHHLPFLADDALISLRYAERFLAGLGLTWNDGERVEGYSNLLWILLCCVPGLFGADLVVASRVLGVLGMAAAAMALLAEMARRKEVAAGWPWAPAPLFFALAGPTAVWAIGGMEAGLVTGLLGWALVAGLAIVDHGPADTLESPYRRRIRTCSFLLGLLCLARPDGAVLAAGLIAGLLAARWRRDGRTGLAVRLAAGPVLAVAGQLVFRLAYYGTWLPNTALVKLGWSSRRLTEGWTHVLEGWAWLQPLTILAAAGAVHAFTVPKTRPRALAVLAISVVWSVYLALVGGDVFPAFRHFPPLALTAAALVGLGLESLALRVEEQRRSRTSRLVRPVRGARLQFFPIWLAVLLLALPFGWRQLRGPHADEVAANRYVWHGRAIALTLRTAFGDRDPLFAVTAAGCLPYWSGFRSLDLLGLCDEHIARNRPESFGTGPLAHELGDPNYLLERAPDLMFFGPPGPGAGRQLGGRYGHDLLADPRFRNEYSTLCLRIDDAEPFRCYIWMRATSSVLGWRLRGDSLTIPAYFFNGNLDSEAVLNEAGTLGLTVSPDVPAYLRLGDLGREILAVQISPQGNPSAPAVRSSFFHDRGGALCLALEADEPSWVESVALMLEP